MMKFWMRYYCWLVLVVALVTGTILDALRVRAGSLGGWMILVLAMAGASLMSIKIWWGLYLMLPRENPHSLNPPTLNSPRA